MGEGEIKMNDPKILKAERTGGDSPMIATYCQWCNSEIIPGTSTCQKCRDAEINRKDDESKDDRLFKEK